MTFSDAIKNNIDEKHLKLLSGELNCAIPKVEIASLDEYEKKRSEFQERIEQEETALKDAMQTLKDKKQAADEKERQKQEKQHLEEEARLEKERREKWEREAPQREAARKKAQRIDKIKDVIIMITISAVIIAIICGVGLLFKSIAGRYSEDNINLTITDKAYPDDIQNINPCHFILDVNVENKGSVAINRIDGVIRFYNEKNELLTESDAWLTGIIESDNNYTYEFEVKENATEETFELHNTPLHKLKITWEFTKVIYENGKEKEYTSGKEIVINEITESPDKLSSQEIEDSKLDSALKVFETTEEDNANGFSVELEEARNTILSLLGNDCTDSYFGENFEKVYAAAQNYEEQELYGKAYWLYDVLGYYGYEETVTLANKCYDLWFVKSSLKSIAEKDDNDPNFRISVSGSLDTITQSYYMSDFAELIKEIVYNEAVKFKQQGQYHKAYYLFEELTNVGYQDSAKQLEMCEQQILISDGIDDTTSQEY